MIEHVFPCMGNTAHIWLPPNDARAITYVKQRLSQLESLWSRFIPTSEISTLNMATGKPVRVSTETITLVMHLIEAFNNTGGLFNPTLLPALIKAGYARSLVNNSNTSAVAPGSSLIGQPEQITINQDSNTITLPVGTTLDPGGLGKGLAADIVAGELLNIGVSGASVSIGGDVALAGSPDDGDNWVINIGNPLDPDKNIDTVRMRTGAVATSSLSAKTWTVDGVQLHHVIDPQTQAPVQTMHGSTLQASVIASSAVWAEAFATALTVAHPNNGLELIHQNGLATLLVLDDGSLLESDNWDGFR